MDAQNALSELEQLCEKLDVEVQYDRFTGDGARSGGICRIKGKWRVILERRSADSEKVSVLARCLARFDTDGHFASPAVRRLLDRHRAQFLAPDGERAAEAADDGEVIETAAVEAGEVAEVKAGEDAEAKAGEDAEAGVVEAEAPSETNETRGEQAG